MAVAPRVVPPFATGTSLNKRREACRLTVPANGKVAPIPDTSRQIAAEKLGGIADLVSTARGTDRLGRYACELIKDDSGRWRFSRRTVFHDHDYTLDGIAR